MFAPAVALSSRLLFLPPLNRVFFHVGLVQVTLADGREYPAIVKGMDEVRPTPYITHLPTHPRLKQNSTLIRHLEAFAILIIIGC